jgi:hypothetical protein
MERSSHLPRLQKVGQGSILLIILLTSLLACFGLQPVSIPAKGSIYYPPASEVLFADGFENGDFSSWNGTYLSTGNNASVSVAHPYDGSYSARLQTNPAASGLSYAYTYVQLSASVSEVYARAYFYVVNGLPLIDNEDRVGLIGFEIGNQLQGTFSICRSGNIDRFNIIGVNGTSEVSVSTDAVYPTEGKWFCIEFYIRVHESIGEYRAWIDGVQQIAIENVNTATCGVGVSRVRFGLTYNANIQQYVELLCDSVVVSTTYIGQEYSFGIIESPVGIPAIRNFYWLLGNQSIRYRVLMPSEVRSSFDIELLDGLIVWTRQGGYNTTAIKQFAQTKVVISDVIDFCDFLYPTLNSSHQIVTTRIVSYVEDWGNFRAGDQVEMRNMTGDVDRLTTVLNSGLAGLVDVTVIARYDVSQAALFHAGSTQRGAGFYVMDLDATTPTTEWSGIWHLFPAIKTVRDFPTGRYARWFANGIDHWTYEQIMARLSQWVSNAPSGMNASLVRIGRTVLGRDINATRFGSGSRYIIIDGAMHGNEKNPPVALLRLLEVIQQNFQSNGYWKDRLSEVSLMIIPILNPDGFVANTRQNANGVDLDRQFPPQMSTEPEAWAVRWLWANYSTVTHITLHEGRHWQPLDYFYATNYTTTSVDVKDFSRQNCYWTGDDFKALKHWGFYDEKNWSTDPLPINQTRLIAVHSGTAGQIDLGASYLHNASAYLIEGFVWSSSYEGINHKARQMLWAMDYYITTVLGMISHLDRLRNDDFLVVTQGNIKSFVWNNNLRLVIDTSELPNVVNSTTKIDVGNRPKPLSVSIDGTVKTEGQGWTYSSGVATITGAKNTVEIGW